MADITTRERLPEDHTLPSVAGPAGAGGNGRQGGPEVLRREIEDTRARMTRTLDEIEGRLVRQKEELVARATFRDFRHRISSKPWRSIAIAFVAGYVIAAIRD
ncbi:MAG TPA: DUF3618 domain-containing protein [Longimicrobiales bacterium]|nr:DUF3618 domain-containing protein [Longimicrobiales bacterium]